MRESGPKNNIRTKEELEGGLNTQEGYSGGVSEEKARELGINTSELTETRVEAEEKIGGIKEKINEGFDKAAPVENVASAMETAGKFSGELAVFNKFPEVASYVEELVKKTEGTGVKAFFTKGYNKDVLEFFVGGAKNVSKDPLKMERYQKAIKEGGVKLALEYLERSHKEYMLNIKDGKITERGKYGEDSGIGPV